MARTSNTSLIASTQSAEFKPFHAVELQFYDGIHNVATPLYFWSGVGNITNNGKTYAGVGQFLNVSDIEEAAEMKATGITISLSGVPEAVLQAALLHEYSGRVGKVYFGMVGNANWDEVFTGLMDTMEINDEATSSTITLSLESRLIDLQRPNPVRFTVESHQLLSAGDEFFSFTANLQDQQPEWGPN